MVLMGGGSLFGATKVTNTSTKTSSSKSEDTSTKTSSSKSESRYLSSWYKPQTVAINAGLDLWALLFGGLGVSGGAEWTFTQYTFGEQVPLDFGVAAQGFYYTYGYSYWTYSWRVNYLGVGVFGTAHFGPKKSMPSLPDFLQKMDFYIGIGLYFRSVSISYSDPTVQAWYDSYYNNKPAAVGFASLGGVTYFLTDNLGIRFDGSYYSDYGGGTISLLYKF